MKIRFTKLIGIFALLFISNVSWSQLQSPLDIAQRHIEDNYKNWDLTSSDIEDMEISNMYKSKKSGLTHIYFKQRHNEIALQNAILNVNITEEGEVLYVGKRFETDLQSKVLETSSNLSANEALQFVFNDLGITNSLPRSIEGNSQYKFKYFKDEVSKFDIPVELTYVKNKAGIQLVWSIIIDPSTNIDMWEYHIDATTGAIVNKKDMLIHCSFEKNPFHNHDAHCRVENSNHNVKHQTAEMNSAAMAGTYRVFALPTESPIHGDHVLVTDPNDLIASPFGWHDTNGDADPEFTITRGNNVHAFPDRDGDGVSAGDEPDGGMTLTFDYPYTADGEALDNIDAATVNLFYMNNAMHDFNYLYGFDEAAGNFQLNTYSNGGIGNDHVLAYAQAGADAGALNNATFGTPPDGGNPSMNMFVWDNPGGGNFNVTAPNSIAGNYNSINAEFGGAITEVPVIGEVVIVDDGVFDPLTTDGCEDLLNAAELVGKVALIDRSGCEFGAKALRAEEAGAIAVIICNFDPDPVGMAAGAVGAMVTIPTVMIGVDDCATIRQFAGNGLEVSFVTPTITGPDFLDGDFDNGIIAHEYGHGISNRLTGGGNNTGCLSNLEQMGEGWSDYFSLIMTVKPGDTGEMRRGVGTYVFRQDTDGRGIRRFPYSTDMNINPLTYGDVAANTEVHALGEVWTAMIWDLYWAMVEEHGFDEDLWTGTGGNNMAMQLVMEGMKIQECGPGFVDGRDAILAADEALYGGANQCLIWGVFARRGCGINADQGSPDIATDQVENFETVPTCIAELKIDKSVTPLVNAGDDIDISIEVINHRDMQLTGVTVTDEIPTGTSYVDGSCSLGAAAVSISGNMISFDLGTMEYLDELTFTYQLSTSEDNYSITSFIEDVENVDFSFWFPIPITVDVPNIWTVSTDNAYTGMSSWYVENIVDESHQILQGGQPSNQIMVTGDNPVLRFYHSYNTEPGADGGVVQISTDGGSFWNDLGEDIFRGEYDGTIQYATFVIPNFPTFFGDSEGWIASYVDLSDYAGQEVILRWNFATDDNTAPDNGFWFVDDIEIMDMVNYNAEACVTSDQGDEACATPEGRGTVIESQMSVGFNDPLATVSMNIFPNPTDDQINLSITSEDNQNVVLSVLTLDGKELLAKNVQTSTLTQTFSLDVSALPAGFYFVKASTNKDVVIEKIVIN